MKYVFALACWLVIVLVCVWLATVTAEGQCNPPCPYTKLGCCSELFRPAAPGDENLFAQGCYEGNGNDNRRIVTGITNPGLLLVAEKNEDPFASGFMVMRIPEAVGDDSCFLNNNADTCATNMIQEQNILGYFTVGTDGNVNANSDDYCWYQWALGPNHATFTYTGDGSGNRTIDIGMANPDFVMVKSTANSSGLTYAKSDLMPTDVSYPWDDHLFSEPPSTTRIRNVSSAGIEIGSSFNVTNEVYWGAAWKTGSDYGETFTWVGNGTSGGGQCATTADVQTVNVACSARNIIASQCTLDSCEGEACAFQSPGLAVIRGTNIGTYAVGPGNITGDNYYAQSATRDRNGFISLPQSGTSFDVRGEATGSGSANDDGATYYGWVTCAPGPVIGTVTPVDWSPGFVAVWHMEDGIGTVNAWTNHGCTSALGGTGGTFACGFPDCDCNLTASGTVVQDTVEKRIGNASGLFAVGDGDYLSCDMTTACDEFDLGQGGNSLSWGAFVRATEDVNFQVYLAKTGSAVGQYLIGRNPGIDTIFCGARNSGGTQIFDDSAGTMTINDWHFAACEFDNPGDTLQAYLDGLFSGSPAAVLTDLQGGDDNLTIGGNDEVALSTANIDEAFVYAGLLTATDLCRICSCGVTGGACSCWSADTTVYLDEGFNDTMCGDCTLPSCDKIAPS